MCSESHNIVFLPKMHNLNLIMWKHQTHPKVLLKNFNVMENELWTVLDEEDQQDMPLPVMCNFVTESEKNNM